MLKKLLSENKDCAENVLSLVVLLDLNWSWRCPGSNFKLHVKRSVPVDDSASFRTVKRPVPIL